MTELLKAGPNQSAMPVPQPAPLPPVPTLFQEKISFPKQAKTLPEFWRVYDQNLRRYFSPRLRVEDRQSHPGWHNSNSEGNSEDRWYKNKDMLFQLEKQVAYVHAHKSKVADRGKAVAKVLDAWASKMRSYTYTKPDGTQDSITLTASDCGGCFRAAAKGARTVTLKQLKGNQCVTGYAQEFMRVFRASDPLSDYVLLSCTFIHSFINIETLVISSLLLLAAGQLCLSS